MMPTFGIGYFKSNMLLSFNKGMVIRFGRTQNDAMTSPIAPRRMLLKIFLKKSNKLIIALYIFWFRAGFQICVSLGLYEFPNFPILALFKQIKLSVLHIKVTFLL